MERLRIEKNAFHIGLACRLLSEQLEKPDAGYDVGAELVAMGETTQDLRQRAGVGEFLALVPICEGIEAAYLELKQAIAAGNHQGSAAKPLALLDQFSKAVQLSVSIDKDEAAFADAIGSTVERIKSRRAAVVQDRMEPESPRAAEA